MDSVVYKIFTLVGLFFIFVIIFWVVEWVWYKVFIEQGKWMKLE